MDTEAVKTFYDLLRHKKQTEIRAIELSKDFKTSKVRGHYFVSSEEEFVGKVKELNGKYNLYAGLNERTDKGTEATDVISVKRIFADIDCINKPASAEDLKEAEKITDEVISVIETKTGLRATKIYSGNGYQLLYCIPEIEITEENREEIQAQIQQFLKDLIKRYSNDKVRLDNVGDLPRIIRITGTTNIKGGKTSAFIEVHKEDNPKLRDYISSLKPETAQLIIGELETSLNEILEKDDRVKALFNNEPEAVKKFKSRSEKEQSLVCHLIGLGLDREQIFKVMASCKIGKWQEANIQYRELTYKKALEIISKEKKENVQKQAEEVKCYEDVPINPETSLDIFNPIFEGVEKVSLNPLQVDKRYKVYKGVFGIGQNPIFIITQPNEHLNQGFQDLRLRKVDFQGLLEDYCKGKAFLLPDKNKVFGGEILKKYEEGMSSLEIFKKEFERNSDKAFFYETMKPTTSSNLIKAVQKIGFEKMLNDFIYENGSIDKRFYYVFRIGMLHFGNKYHKGISKYNNHNLIITNTKTGKSTQLEKQTRLKYDSATASRLLGYSTGDRSFEGDLQGEYKQIVLDDFSTASYQKEILDSLPSILENGKSLIGKGKKQILTECSSQFTLTTNSNKAIEEKELVLEFVKILNRLSETLQRIGSRFACILFGNDFQEAQTKEFKLSKRGIEINKFLIEQIFEELSEQLIKLRNITEVEMFLESPNENYRKTIKNIAKNEHNFFGELKDFWESTSAGDRHQKGFALKQGFLEFFLENEDKLILSLQNSFEFSKEDVQQIIDFSQENLEMLNDMNLSSLKNIIKIQKTEGDYLNLRFNGLNQGYLKAIIKAVFRLIRERPEQRTELIPLVILNDYLDKELEMYNRIGQVQQKLPAKFERLNKDLRVFGLELLEKEGNIFIQTHKEAFNSAYKINLGTGTKEECTNNVPTMYQKENTKTLQNPSINDNNVPNVPNVPIKNKSEIDFFELDKAFENE